MLLVLAGIMLPTAALLFMGAGSSALKPTVEERRLAHTGYYVADSAFVFTNEPTDAGFDHPSLASRESLIVHVGSGGPDLYSVSHSNLRYPLRIDGRCLNVDFERWPEEGGTITIELDSTFLSFSHQPPQKFFVTRGVVRSGQRIAYPGMDHVLGKKIELIEGWQFSSMLESATSEAPDLVGLLNAEWWQVLEQIVWVREIKGEKNSKLGFLVSPSVLEDSSRVAVFLNEERLEDTDLGQTSSDGVFRMDTESHGSQLTYGLGRIAELSLRFGWNTDQRLDRIAEAYTLVPSRWRLPPEPDSTFLITSTHDEINLPGYQVNVGNTPHAIFAKAHVTPDLDSLVVNDGYDEVTYGLGQAIRLGSQAQGAVVSLLSLEAWTLVGLPLGPLVALLILIHLILFDAATHGKRDLGREPETWNWILVVWTSCLILLLIRVILAYRLSLNPPNDATSIEIRSFDTALKSSFAGLVFIPLLLTGTRWLGRIKLVISRIADLGSSLGISTGVRLFWIYCVATIVWVLLSGIVGDQEVLAVLPLRISLVVHLMVVVAILYVSWMIEAKMEEEVGGAETIDAHTRPPAHVEQDTETHFHRLKRFLLRLEHFGSTKNSLLGQLSIYALVLYAMLIYKPIEDGGSFVYLGSIPLSFAAAAALRFKASPGLRFSFTQNRSRRRTRSIAMKLLVGLGVGAIVASPMLYSQYHRSHVPDFDGEVSIAELGFGRADYREIARRGDEGLVLTTPGSSESVKVDDLLRSAQQRWQMLAFGAAGSSRAMGYASAPLVKQGMTYPTMMTDCVFSMLVLAEHGGWSGILILLIYLLAGISCFMGAFSLSAKHRWRLPTLLAVGAYFIVNPLYISGANVDLYVFTGQNLPLLSLVSGSDLFHGCVLLICVICLLSWGIGSSDAKKGNTPMWNIARSVLIIVPFVGIALAAFSIFVLAGEADLRTQSYDLPRERLINAQDEVDSTLVLNLNSNSIEFAVDSTKLSALVRHYADDFNRRANRTSLGSGFIFADLENETHPLRISQQYFRLGSPFHSSSVWEGRLVGDGGVVSAPSFSGLGREFALSIGEGDRPAVVGLSNGIVSRASHLIQLKEQDVDDMPIICEIENRNGNVVLIPRRIVPLVAEEWRVFLNGEELSSARQLRENDLIVLQKRNSTTGAVLLSRNLLYQGVKRPTWAFTQWRNGRYQRVFPQGTAFGLAYAIGQAADEIVTVGTESLGMDISITLDMELQRALQSRMISYGLSSDRPRYRLNDPLLSPRVAMTVMDAFSGEVLALPSYPSVDPNAMQDLLDRLSPANHFRVYQNHNLTNHSLGSTTKPIMFAAMSSAFWGVWDLAQVELRNHSETRLLGIPLPEENSCLRDPPTIDATDYLVNSRNCFQLALGLLGFLERKEGLARALTSATIDDFDVAYRDTYYKVDLLGDGVPTPLSSGRQLSSRREPQIASTIDRSLLFRYLPALFSVHVDSVRSPLTPLDSLRLSSLDRFLPSLPGRYQGRSDDSSTCLSIPTACQILPDPVVFQPGRTYQWLRRNYFSFLLGGGENVWNNVAISEAAARLISGEMLSASLQSASETNDSMPMPAPINDPVWMDANLFTPMELSGLSGTSRSLRGGARWFDSPPPGLRYRALFKTGSLGVDRLDDFGEEFENEHLLFVLGLWDDRNQSFVEGLTVTGFLFMEDASYAEGEGDMQKFVLAELLLDSVGDFLARRAIALTG